MEFKPFRFKLLENRRGVLINSGANFLIQIAGCVCKLFFSASRLKSDQSGIGRKSHSSGDHSPQRSPEASESKGWRLSVSDESKSSGVSEGDSSNQRMMTPAEFAKHSVILL